MGDGKSTEAIPVQVRPGGKPEEIVATRAIERADYPQVEVGRELRNHGQRPGLETWDGLFQHKCVVPHHGQESETNQEGRIR